MVSLDKLLQIFISIQKGETEYVKDLAKISYPLAKGVPSSEASIQMTFDIIFEMLLNILYQKDINTNANFEGLCYLSILHIYQGKINENQEKGIKNIEYGLGKLLPSK